MSAAKPWDETRMGLALGTSLGEVLAARAHARPDSVALVHGEQVYTYVELDRLANRLAHRLRARGVVDEARVGICLERSSALVIALMAVVKAGGAYVPLDPSYPDDRLRYMCEDAGCALLLGRAQELARLGGERARGVDLDVELRELEGLGPSPDDQAPGGVEGGERLAYVMYTSGSTGRPKRVMITHRGVLRLVDHGLFEFGPEDVATQVINASFDGSTWEIWPTLLSGAALVIIDRPRVMSPTLPHTLFAHGVTSLTLPTALFNYFADELPNAFSSLRYVIFGGEAADPARLARVLASDPPERLVNVYGPTETTVICAMHEVGSLEPGATRVPIGHAVRGITLHVLDKDLARVGDGEPGELYVGGVGLARGYQGAPGLTAARFLPDPFSAEPGHRMYRSGDIVRQLPSGALEFLGRVDDQVKLRGVRIELGEIEAVLREHPAVVDAVVLVREEGMTKRLVAYVGAPGGAEERGLREHLKGRLPEAMHPSTITVLPRLPVSPNGKVDRAALRRGEAGGTSA
ncbi:amino acid adenylation domain-containing protein [Polyangium sp. 15x6]|uniref:amino acid adenylation domain-containing protein n=1 Tax=Polyangium sp. 15x6 TaxID=3042687 RepID=UPI00249B7AFC|nr:amino acid adenylation domain-containing protein [Polyangium sp. 15x6]MDI3288327.1 amino acid adenylation domain-containing protein [Polyangium sp. 15x6]